MYLVDENETKILVNEVEQIDDRVKLLLFKARCRLKEADRIKLQKKLSKETGCKCIVLDSIIERLYVAR